MRVFLTGGTGAIGRYALPALVKAGHDVTALTRSAAKAEQVEAAGATPAAVDLFDRDALAEAVAGYDAVVNLATSIPVSMTKSASAKGWDDNSRIRTEGAANLVDAALAHDVRRFVQESIAFAYEDSGDEWIDEDRPLHPAGPVGPVAAAEASARRFAEAGGERVAVVLRFGFFYGLGSAHTEAMLKAARRHVGPSFGPADHWVSSIHLEDGAAAVVAALGAPGGTYNVVDEPVTWREFAEALGQAVGEAPWLRVPGRLMTLFGERGGTLSRSQRASNRRFREATGWAPRYRSAWDGWPAVVEAAERETVR
jgi:nucleoside-diphosphate-sugar epimerase